MSSTYATKIDEITVIKRDGTKVPVDYEKINKVLLWATEGINGVSASDIAMNTNLQLFNGIKTEDIHRIVIQSAVSMIKEESPNYQFVSANLLNYLLRKQVFDVAGDNMPSLCDVIKKNVKYGVYDSIVLEKYTESEIEKLNSYLRHQRDFNFVYAGLQQMIDKYLLKDRKTNKMYETPQFMYMLIAMTLFADEDQSKRLSMVRSFYNDISNFKISLPTPIMSGVRTPNRQYSSCTLIDVGDSLDSIGHSDLATMYYTSKRAGIGLNFGRVRAIGDKIRNGEVIHTGVIPFLKKFESTTKSCTQNGIRGGASTTHFPYWHKEILDILVLKNNKGTDDNRVRKMDYSIQFNRLFYKRFIENSEITTFSPHDVPDLYEAFASGDNDLFEKLYEEYENKKKISSKKVKARDLMNVFVQERIETGRMYVMNMDHVNNHSSFLKTIYMSNLCVAPETKILTKNGYEQISNLKDQVVTIWNGENWSNTVVKQTGENQKLIEIKINDYESITCTPYHRFFVVPNYKSIKRNKIVEKRAFELQKGDKLIKFNLPVIDGFFDLENAYALGLHTGDGSSYKEKNINFIDLYQHKRKLIDKLPVKSIHETTNKTRVVLDISNIEKFKVPNAAYTILSRIKWLAGYIDADGSISVNGNNKSLQFKSVNLPFLKELKLMLHSLGIDSKITFGSEEGYNLLPDGKGGKKEYFAKKSYRLLISSSGLYKLVELGLNNELVNRKIDIINKPNRNSEKYHIVTDVLDNNRYDDTYCFTEIERGMGMFNGFLLGNCQEITLPTTPINHIETIYDNEGEIALCVLSAVNVGELKSLSELEGICRNIVYSLDFVIENQDYPVKAALKMLKRRSIGVGVTNLAYYLAKNDVNYDDPKALHLIDELMEYFQFYLLKASNELAKEKGACEWFNETKYSKGILPIDTYNKEVDNLIKREYSLDWEGLRKDILKYGLRNSTLSAQMPCESSSLTTNSTNGIEPVRSLITAKVSKQGVLRQVVPDIQKLKNKYQLAFDLQDNRGITNIVAVMQKYMDQSISTNHYYDYRKYPDNQLPLSVIIKDIMYAYKVGVKTLYYANTNDASTDDLDVNITDQSCESGACSI